MGKQLRWSADDLKKKGLVQNENGDYVPVSSLVAKGKVNKFSGGMNPDTEPAKMITIKQVVKDYLKDPDRQHKDLMLATGFRMQIENQMRAGIDPVSQLSRQSDIDVYQKGADGIIARYFSRDQNTEVFKQLLDELKNYSGTSVLEEGNFFTLPSGERIKIKFDFDLAPFPAPRMTRGDKWKTDPCHPDPTRRQRKCVFEYFAWRDAFQAMSAQKGFMLDERLHAVCITPFPESYSRKKRETLLNQYHKQRPDADNFGKSIMDSFKVDDGYVCDLRIVKLWGPIGRILIF